MFELRDIHPDIGVQEPEYIRLLGFPAYHVLEGRSRELAEEARAWYTTHGKPWIYAKQIDRAAMNGVFSSPQLQENFDVAGVDTVMLTVVSAGPECEARARELWTEGKPDEYFFMEMFGSAVVEHLITVASGRICGWADGHGRMALPHYSPGYSGWDVAEQTKLWNLIRQSNGQTFPGELRVFDTGMLQPKKSLLAVFGITREIEKVKKFARLVPCETCSLQRCQYRRAPYQYAIPQVEDVHRLESGNAFVTTDAAASPSGLRYDAKYSINLKALRKWSQERLQLKARPDGLFDAHFRYEGTTCSNMGRPLEFHYDIMLGAAHDGYRILEARCRPAPGDTGHMQQCEYLKDPVAFMAGVGSEKPLLGHPLNEVLTWQREFSPSGCYCDSSRRLHKWGLVYEVIHYALVQREKEADARHGAADLK